MRHLVGTTDDLPTGTLRRVEVAGVPVCLARLDDGAVHAIGDLCSHEEIELSDGDLDGCEVICPAHGSCFDVRTGKPDGLPATEPVPTYPVSLDGADIYVEI
ncbi:MAG TPA: non-heme iron oxygenase ferredoxin subunit [Sporichthyaceae bacterium]|jgi:3-phenylpropionate/trans-cinnamate dioxygenase ferredoxin subunit|nr:non-heme iron oxygenase ferredoxin subunit [Sporichthyaceae bacterium]